MPFARATHRLQPNACGTGLQFTGSSEATLSELPKTCTWSLLPAVSNSATGTSMATPPAQRERGNWRYVRTAIDGVAPATNRPSARSACPWTGHDEAQPRLLGHAADRPTNRATFPMIRTPSTCPGTCPGTTSSASWRKDHSLRGVINEGMSEQKEQLLVGFRLAAGVGRCRRRGHRLQAKMFRGSCALPRSERR